MAISFWSNGQILLICELGQRLTNRFFEIDDEIFCSNWYTLPVDVQKMLLILVNGTQRPIVISGIGNTECTREGFKSVSDSNWNLNNTELNYSKIHFIAGIDQRVFLFQCDS